MTKKKRLRDIPMQFYVTEDERNVIEDKAKYLKLSMSEYMRQMCIKGLIIKRDLKGLDEINRIGVNINQIAKKANESGHVIERDIEELRVQYEKLFEIVYGQIISG